MRDLETYNLFGLKISVFTKADLIKCIDDVIFERKQFVFFGYSLGYLSLFKKFPHLYEKVNKWEVMVTDGRFFYLYAKLFGAPLKYDISIPFLSELIMQRAGEKGYSILIIGSDDSTNRKASEAVRQKYKGAKVLEGRSGGSFSQNEQVELVNYVNTCKPDILFIGTSTPIKENFTHEWREQLDVRIIVPFGGMIDGLAGKVKLTPRFLKKLGLASLVRMFQEPKRLLRRNLKMYFEFFFKLLPLTMFYRVILRQRNFNLIEHYQKLK